VPYHTHTHIYIYIYILFFLEKCSSTVWYADRYIRSELIVTTTLLVWGTSVVMGYEVGLHLSIACVAISNFANEQRTYAKETFHKNKENCLATRCHFVGISK